MGKIYEVYGGDESVGTACVNLEGLYYHVQIRCELSGNMMHKAVVRCNGHLEDLGILVPENGVFIMNTRIPMKKIGEGELYFRVIPRHKPLQGTFVPLAPEEPFTYLTRLKDAFLANQNGEIGIFIKQT